jgi:hypothetical protein
LNQHGLLRTINADKFCALLSLSSNLVTAVAQSFPFELPDEEPRRP